MDVPDSKTKEKETEKVKPDVEKENPEATPDQPTT
jgi:hypothetical protein